MIPKKYRLKENEVKKVLQKGKPFFSLSMVANLMQNKIQGNRFAIVIGGKSVSGSIVRNYFRRRFYAIVSQFIDKKIKNGGVDLVFVVKKSTLLQPKNSHEEVFDRDLKTLLEKIFT